MTGLLIYCTIYYLAAGVAIVIGYHRHLSHRALKLKKWFAYLIITAGLPAGTPVQWVGNHRYHHAHTDVENDPHSPVIQGFWYAHNGWYIQSANRLLCFFYAIAGPFRFLVDAWNRPRTNQQYNDLTQDVADDPYYNFISKPWPYFVALWLHAVIAFGLAFYFWGVTGFFALWITLIIIFNFGDAIDSVAHLYGEQPYRKKDHARNNLIMAIFTLGDGWHADHHQFPGSAKVGFKKGRVDISWHFIRLLRFLKIAYDIRVASSETVKKQLR
ncbi:fatty acid desaturase [Sinomicrobium sp. M5D2P17]